MDALVKRYEMEDEAWLCTQKLKEYGVNVESWVKPQSKEGV